ncbi:DUF167 domain-containing protein [Levilinea saccharolytica]|uniref:UPF0235 protein ADN01_06455 n=1 Tax=Levilinea saccharolytica TaxID=229921 RepID=A0A0P6YIU6_9CHLR|nr:DUF167 domain-containing protein [Levilinea saccharolytica]KPL85012.1 hypothetical protein ADN01_06455 [Levilinea saccharolytica]GAP18114.1 uncharacterized conserved protein [Levilinea saccharolytica]
MDDPRKYRLHNGQRGAALAIRVTPRARKNEITEILNDGTVKVRLTSADTDDLVNNSLLDFLAGVLGVDVARLDIVAGKSGLDKLVTVTGLDTGTVQSKIIEKLS